MAIDTSKWDARDWQMFRLGQQSQSEQVSAALAAEVGDDVIDAAAKVSGDLRQQVRKVLEKAPEARAARQKAAAEAHIVRDGAGNIDTAATLANLDSE